MTVYFATYGKEKLVKIGHTGGSPKKRLMGGNTFNPHRLKLIGTIPGPVMLEKFIQRLLQPYHYDREWFRYTPELKWAIKKITAVELEDIFKAFDKIKKIIKEALSIGELT